LVKSLIAKGRARGNPIGAKVLAIGHAVLRLLNAVGAKILAIGHAGLRLLNAVGADILAIRCAILDTLDAVGANLLAVRQFVLHLFRTVRANLLTLSDARAPLINAVRTHLLSLCRASSHAFRLLRPHALGTALIAALNLRKALLALDTGCGDAGTALARHRHWSRFRPLRTLSTFLLRDLGAIAALRVWLRTGRGCDRQSSDTCGENQPGHHKISFRTAKRCKRRTVPLSAC
jgi:hypothetical protein